MALMKTRLLALCLLAAAPLTLAACGGGTKANASSSSTTTGNANNAAFRECLSEHGVDVSAGNFGPPGGSGAPNGSRPDFADGQGTPPRGSFPGGNDPKFQEAFSACRSKLPSGGNDGAGFGQYPQALQAYTSCLKDHGVKVPSTSSGSGNPGALGSLQSDPKFAAANKTCRALLPARNGTTTTTAGR
jgi:hypothetical protein